jgi:molybdopterin converting factor small subunit
MSIQILSFGSITDITGSSYFTMPMVADTSLLIAALKEKFPALADKKFILAVNAVTVTENTILKTGNIIALLPPFSGG